jgi:hypothetical protein
MIGVLESKIPESVKGNEVLLAVEESTLFPSQTWWARHYGVLDKLCKAKLLNIEMELQQRMQELKFEEALKICPVCKQGTGRVFDFPEDNEVHVVCNSLKCSHTVVAQTREAVAYLWNKRRDKRSVQDAV